MPERLIQKIGTPVSNSQGLPPVPFHLFKWQSACLCVMLEEFSISSYPLPVAYRKLVNKYDKFGLNKLSTTVQELSSRSGERI